MDKNKKILFAVFFFLLFFYIFFFSPPVDFKAGSTVRIEQGMSLLNISALLKNKKIIRSTLAFEAFVVLYGGEKHLNYSDYLFEKKLSVWTVAKRISKGENHMPPVVVTIPEGFNTMEIAETFASKLANFNKNEFLKKATPLEGYLFPDTYFFLNIGNDADVIRSMNGNYEKKIASLRPEIIASGKTEKQIIIMASLVEGEAQGDSDRGFISGILWKRLVQGMPLQVDVAPDTYKTKGLPKNPIGNPGIKSILAAIHPEKSSYFYYLHDKNGEIHYARTFYEHQANIKKYLQ